MDQLEQVGVIVVHGIGDQRRFEHIDSQARYIVSALRARSGSKVTVDILGAESAAFQAQQDSWGAQETVRVMVSDAMSGKRVQLNFHEVWWADVNEPYSLFKQLRFWRWGLTVWLYPDKPGSTLATTASVRTPVVRNRLFNSVLVRMRLFGIAFVAVIGAASIGMITFLAERLLNLRPPNFVRVFVNYVAGVKLYNQKKRMGAGFPAKQQDFLDTLDEPPRVSVRRRMIRTIMDVAERPYQRWYVFAHSLGSVIAFNGLMETAYAWPGYFTAERWRGLRRTVPADSLVGPAKPDWAAPRGNTMPERPVWTEPREIAYRSRIFHNFHGLLTFGSPLEKFAAIWPARVPISREPAFRQGTAWLNIYDPLDPISGALESFSDQTPACCPAPQNIGYAAGPVLLLNHLRYLTKQNGNSLADGVAEWLITGNSGRISARAGPRWFPPNERRHRVRTAVAWLSWVALVLLLAALGGLVLPVVATAAWNAIAAIALALRG